MKKVRVAMLRCLVCPPSAATARAVGFDASSRSSTWRRRAHLASRSSSPSEATSLLINFYTFGPRIVSLRKENSTCLIKHPDFGPILFLQIRSRDPFGRLHLGSSSPRLLQTSALKPNAFAFGNQQNVRGSRGEHIFTFSSICCAKPSGGHHPQLRNTNFRELERDDDDF